MDIAAVVFDYGGVICFPPPPENTAELERLTGLPAETLRELNRKYRVDWDRGVCNGVDFYRRILSGDGIFPEDGTLARIAETDMDGWKNINPATVLLMRDIKAAGFCLGILSNMPPDFLAWARQNIAVFNQTDVAVFSCDYNLIKPETGIYEKLKEKINCRYAQIVFFDDVIDNVTKAQELGISGFVWDGPEGARKILKGLGGGFSAL